MKNPLWRYMDLTKFERMLKSNSLYFCSARCFEDNFEAEYAWGPTGHNDYIKNIQKLVKSHGADMDIAFFMAMHLKDIKDLSSHSYISCWNKNYHESEAMWKLYCNDVSNGIVIRTSINTLKESLAHSNKNLIFKAVKYTPNYFVKKYNPEISEMLCHKRSSFNHENEYRVFFSDPPTYSSTPPKGLNISVNIEQLLLEIRVSPYSTKEFKNQVIDLLNKYNLNIPVNNSEIKVFPLLGVDEKIIETVQHPNGSTTISSRISLITK